MVDIHTRDDTSYRNCFKDYQLEITINIEGQIERPLLGQVESELNNHQKRG